MDFTDGSSDGFGFHVVNSPFWVWSMSIDESVDSPSSESDISRTFTIMPSLWWWYTWNVSTLDREFYDEDIALNGSCSPDRVIPRGLIDITYTNEWTVNCSWHVEYLCHSSVWGGQCQCQRWASCSSAIYSSIQSPIDIPIINDWR